MKKRRPIPTKKKVKWGGQILDSRINELDFLEEPDSDEQQEKDELTAIGELIMNTEQ